MKKNTNKNGGMSKGKMAVVGAGVAALGAGAYYLLGPNAKKHQGKAKNLMMKMAAEVRKDAKKVKNMTMPLYNRAVDNVSRTYSDQYEAHEKEIKAFAKKLKEDWKMAARMAVKQSTQMARKVKARVRKGK